MGSTDKHQTIDELLNQHDFFVDLPAGSITKSSAKKAFKEWLEQQRPKSIESTDEIIVNDFIDYLIKEIECGHVRKVGDMDGYCMDWKPNSFQSNGVNPK